MVNDVTGMPRTAVLLGGSSDIGRAVLAQLAARRLEAVVLAGRGSEALEAVAEELRGLGVKQVFCVPFDVGDVGRHEAFAQAAMAQLGSVDLLLVAAGLLGDPTQELAPEPVASVINTNFTGPAAALAAFLPLLRHQGQGRIVVLSSVAGVRVRRANLVYGAAKAGLDGYCQGVQDLLAGSPLRLMIVRPGFVRTKMTTGLPPQPFSVDATAVAEAIVQGLERNVSVVWVPAPLRLIFSVLRFAPRALWRRLPS